MRKVTTTFVAGPCLVVAGLFGLMSSPRADAVISVDLASATIIQEFQFNDADGTTIPDAANSADPGNLFDTDADTSAVTTNGFGQLNASLKSNNSYGSNYVDLAGISSGRVLAVMELTWNFQSTLNPSENEQVALSLMSADPRTTLATAEWVITREDDDTLTLLGNGVGTGATDLSPVVLNGGSLVQVDTFIAILDLDLDSDTYQVHYSSDGGDNYTSLGTANTDPSRDVESLRMILNNDLSNDNVLIDRIYVAAVPEPGTTALLAGVFMVLLACLRRR